MPLYFVKLLQHHIDFEPIKAIMAGHMNVAVLESFCLMQTHVNGYAFKVANREISQKQLNARWLKVDDLYAEVHFCYFTLVDDMSVVGLEDMLEQNRPQVLVLDCLSEDLAINRLDCTSW